MNKIQVTPILTLQLTTTEFIVTLPSDISNLLVTEVRRPILYLKNRKKNRKIAKKLATRQISAVYSGTKFIRRATGTK